MANQVTREIIKEHQTPAGQASQINFVRVGVYIFFDILTKNRIAFISLYL